MAFETINNLFRSIGTQPFSKESGEAYMLLGIILVILAIFLNVTLNRLKRKGTVTLPSVSASEHAEEIAHLINCELQELYSNGGLVRGIQEKLGSYRENAALRRGKITPGDIYLLPSWKMGFVFVVKYELCRKDDVANGNFGRIMLNRNFFTLRTLHHHYAMMIAAKLFFFQLYAMSGKEPAAIQSNESYTRKAGEAVLAKAGKLEQYAALREKDVINLVKHDRKVDGELAALLATSENETRRIEEEMQRMSRSLHSNLKGESHMIASEKGKVLELLKKEKKQLDSIVQEAERKKVRVRELVSRMGMDRDERSSLEGFLWEWDTEIARLKTIREAIEKIISSQDKWKFKHSIATDFQRVKKADSSEVASKLHAQSTAEQVDINRIHAILTSFTSAKANMLRLIRQEEMTT